MSQSISELSPQQQLNEIAAILARGVLRLKQAKLRIPAMDDKEVLKTPEEDLESGADPRLSGSRCSVG